jgi:uncharacterized protein (DUF488 family)
MDTLIYTVGHSTRSSEEFIELLAAYHIQEVVDVRTIPKSRHNPQFGAEALRQSLAARGIGYSHMPTLGGLRHTTAASINQAWQNKSFRGYADYMQTPEFRRAITELIGRAREKQIVIMCAEAVPWRCHRSLIGDALLVRGVQVEDIMSVTNHKPHKLTPWAKVAGEDVTYPAPEAT